jgi:Ribonuclease G/E
MEQNSTAISIHQTKDQLRQDLDDLQRTWEGIRRTLKTIERACTALSESKEILIKLSRQLPSRPSEPRGLP